VHLSQKGPIDLTELLKGGKKEFARQATGLINKQKEKTGKNHSLEGFSFKLAKEPPEDLFAPGGEGE